MIDDDKNGVIITAPPSAWAHATSRNAVVACRWSGWSRSCSRRAAGGRRLASHGHGPQDQDRASEGALLEAGGMMMIISDVH
jgi:hypothetical protein